MPWKQIGLTEIIFGATDDNGLAAYYQDSDHGLAASCAAVYFQPGVADEETIVMARATAASITAFVLETRGFDGLKAVGSTGRVLSPWAALRGYWDNTPLKDVCGKDYPELYQEFLACLREDCGPLLGISE